MDTEYGEQQYQDANVLDKRTKKEGWGQYDNKMVIHDEESG